MKNKKPRAYRTFDSIRAAAGALRLSQARIQAAKDEGCTAFRSNRVYERELLTWLIEDAQARATGVDPAQLPVNSVSHGVALLSRILCARGIPFWLAASPVFWLTMNKAAEEKESNQSAGKIIELLGNVLKELEMLAALVASMEKGLHESLSAADPRPWIDLSESGATGASALNSLMVMERKKFFGQK